MLGHLNPQGAPPAHPPPALTDAFMAMDDALSRAQAQVRTYYAATGDHSLDPSSWDAVLTQCEAATTTYLAITAPETHPNQINSLIEYGTRLVAQATTAIENFLAHWGNLLEDAANMLARRAAEAQRAQEVAAAEARRAQEEAARRARELPGEAQKALSSIATRISATRARLAGVAPALSTMLREFPAASSADLVGNEDAAAERIAKAADYFGQARSAQHQGDAETAVALAKQIRAELTEAEALIDAVPKRLQMLHELRDDPKKHAKKVRFALHDAQMYAVDRGLTAQWASALDAQLVRIETLEASLSTAHPDYWAYATGLDQVADFIASIVTRMRGR